MVWLQEENTVPHPPPPPPGDLWHYTGEVVLLQQNSADCRRSYTPTLVLMVMALVVGCDVGLLQALLWGCPDLYAWVGGREGTYVTCMSVQVYVCIRILKLYYYNLSCTFVRLTVNLAWLKQSCCHVWNCTWFPYEPCHLFLFRRVSYWWRSMSCGQIDLKLWKKWQSCSCLYIWILFGDCSYLFLMTVFLNTVWRL